MDPNATLEAARYAYSHGYEEEAAEHYAHLDAWISRGGCLPDAWLGPR